MKRRLVMSSGAAQTRAALLRGEAVAAFWFGPARGDEALPRPPCAGQSYFGRIRTVSTALDAAFVDIGWAEDAFLPLDGARPVEGAALAVTVKRPPLGRKGPVVARLDGSPPPVGAAVPAPLAPPRDPTLEALDWAKAQGVIEALTVSDARSAQLLNAAGVNSTIAADAFDASGAAEALDAALEAEIEIPCGARLRFDETEALTAVDIDAGRAAGSGRGGVLNDRVNHAAVARLFLELSRRAIGGRIVVDFLPPSSAAARRRLSDALKDAGAGLYPARFGRLSEDGLFDLTAPRRRLSLLEEATEWAGGPAPRPGRRFTRDWAAKAAVASLEEALRRRPAARLTLDAAPDLAEYLTVARPQWLARVGERYGARFDLAPSSRLEERSYGVG